MKSGSWSNRKATWKCEGFINCMANSIQLLVELVKHTLIAQGEPRCLMNCSALLCLVLCTRVAGCCLPCCCAGQRHFPSLALCLAFLAVLHRRCSPLPNSPAVADLGCAGFAPAWFAKTMQVQESVSRTTRTPSHVCTSFSKGHCCEALENQWTCPTFAARWADHKMRWRHPYIQG